VQYFVNVTLTGLTEGMVYSAFALALVLIWRSTRIVNFAQGSMAAATTFIALALIQAGQSYWVALVVALLSGLVLGAIVERVVIRPVEGGPELNAVIVTLGLFVAIQAAIAIIFGSSFQSFPTPFGLQGFQVGDNRIALTPNSVWVIAAVLVAGGEFVYPAYMDSLIVFGFVAAVLGGLDSPIGAIVGGLILGLALSYVSGYVERGSALVNVAALVILMVVLLVRPGGLFASSTARRA
jgi:branched-chain amino acid transport system permease protein